MQNGTAAVLAEVKSNPAAIAYESLGYAGDPGVKILKVDGVEGTAANIKSGAYKISRPLSVVYQNSVLDGAAAKAFFDFMKSSRTKKIISDKGYVSVVEGAADYTIDGALSGTVNISGSTSLKPLIEELEAEFKNLQPNVTVNVAGGGSGQGYKDAEGGVSEFGMISAEFNPENAPSCAYSTVAKDGIAVIVNKDNPISDIILEQLKDIYDEESGKTPVWSDFVK
jgi:phosphate transport system substrate-binding protein